MFSVQLTLLGKNGGSETEMEHNKLRGYFSYKLFTSILWYGNPISLWNQKLFQVCLNACFSG